MTYCDICHSRIYTYTEYKIDGKTACYHCKIRSLEEQINYIKNLMRNQKFIKINECGFYQILPYIQQYQAQDLVSAIMNVLFEKPEFRTYKKKEASDA